MSEDLPPWEAAKRERIHIPNPQNDPPPWEIAKSAQTTQQTEKQYGEADRALAMASRDYALPILGAPGDFAGWIADAPWLSETVGTKGLTKALGRDKVPPPETTAGRVAAETLGQGVSSMVQGGVIGKGISAAGQLLNKPGFVTGGQKIAEPLTNLVGGIGAGAGGVLGELSGLPGGKTVGSLLGGGVAGASAGRAGGTGKARDPEVEKMLGVYERLGLNPTLTSVGAGNQATRWLEGNVLPQTIGGGRIPNTIHRNFEKVTKQQQLIADAYSGPGTRTRFDTGEDVQKAVGEHWQRAKKEAGDVINKIIEQDVPPNQMFFAGNLASAFSKLKGAARTPEGFDATVDPVVKKIRDLIKENGGHFTARDMQAHFGMLGMELDKSLAAGVDNAQIAQLRQAIGADLDAAVKSLPNKDVYADWQWAKGSYANAMMDYHQAFAKLLGNKQLPVAPERVYDILLNTAKDQSGTNIKMFDTVWRALPKEQKGDLAATVLSRMGQKDKDPTQFGNLDNWSLGNFVKEYATINPEAKRMLFEQNPKQARALDDLVDAAKSLKALEKLASTSRSGTAAVQMTQLGQVGASALTGGIPGAVYSLLGGIGGPAAASWVLTNPAAVKQAAQGLRDMEKGLQTASSAFIAINVLNQPTEPPPGQRPSYERAMSRPPAAQRAADDDPMQVIKEGQLGAISKPTSREFSERIGEKDLPKPTTEYHWPGALGMHHSTPRTNFLDDMAPFFESTKGMSDERAEGGLAKEAGAGSDSDIRKYENRHQEFEKQYSLAKDELSFKLRHQAAEKQKEDERKRRDRKSSR